MPTVVARLPRHVPQSATGLLLLLDAARHPGSGIITETNGKDSSSTRSGIPAQADRRRLHGVNLRALESLRFPVRTAARRNGAWRWCGRCDGTTRPTTGRAARSASAASSPSSAGRHCRRLSRPQHPDRPLRHVHRRRASSTRRRQPRRARTRPRRRRREAGAAQHSHPRLHHQPRLQPGSSPTDRR